MRLFFAAILCACGATPNPAPPTAPAPWKPSAKEPATAAKPATKADVVAGAARDEARAPVAPSNGDDLVIATVAGKPIDVRELIAQWLHRDSIDVLEQLDHLVINRLVLAEAARLGVRVQPEVAEDAYKKSVAGMETSIARKRPGITLDQYVDKLLGLDPLVYRERLREDALRGLIAERVMRSFILQSEHARIRVIVVKTEDKVKEVQAALASGEAFEAAASRLSSDPSAEDGGRVAPVVRSDTVMGRLAFDTAVGTIGGPTYEQGAWLFVRVEERPAPLQGVWREIAGAVEQSLSERGIENIEMQQWETAMHRRYEIDVTPFLRLAGQPTR